jgi:hypothetical protein
MVFYCHNLQPSIPGIFMDYKIKTCFLFSLLVLNTSKAYSWGEAGHSIIGAIAEERMEPTTRNFIAGILGIEPVAVSAVWADAVKDDQRFNHNSKSRIQSERDADDNNFSDFHFVEVPTGFTYDTSPEKNVKDSYGAIAGAITILKAPKKEYPRLAKIIALRYLVHIVGDIHQPLHVGNNFDIGGNVCSVLVENEKYPTNLHAVWDNVLVSEFGKKLVDKNDPKARPAKYYPEYITGIKKFREEKFNQAKPQDVSETAIKSWIAESQAIRESSVYPDAPNSMDNFPVNEKYKHRNYCMWFADQKNNIIGEGSAKSTKEIPMTAIPHLYTPYLESNEKIIEDRLISGGIRLAAVLDSIALEVSKQHPLPENTEKQVFQSLQQIFKNLNQAEK